MKTLIHQATKHNKLFDPAAVSVLPAHGLPAKINYAPPPVRLSTLVKSKKFGIESL